MFWLGALLLAVTIIAFRTHRRRQLMRLQWPAPLEYYRMRTSAGKLFSLDRWDVTVKEGIDMPDCTLKKDDYLILLVCAPFGDYVGPGKLRDLEEFKQRKGGSSPVICITADMPEEVVKEEAMARKVFLMHYKELAYFIGRDIPAIKAHLAEIESRLRAKILLRNARIPCQLPNPVLQG